MDQGERRIRLRSESLYSSMSLVAPPSRMLLITINEPDGPGRRDGPGKDVWFYPVVAVRTMIVTDYTKKEFEDHTPGPSGATHADLLALGYQVLAHTTSDELLVVADLDGDAAVCSLSEVIHSGCLAHRVVVCHWPPERDRDEVTKLALDIIWAGDEDSWLVHPNVIRIDDPGAIERKA
jgi:hypothetical protein